MEEIARTEAFVRVAASWLVHAAEACSVVVILFGLVRAFASFVWSTVRGPLWQGPDTRIRLNLGRALALALEFLLAADILQTAVAPSTDALVQLAVVAVIRTGLNYFLGLELERERREVEPAPAEPRS